VSRAFKRESDEDGAEVLPLVRPQLPPGARNYITRAGADRMQCRLAALLETKRGSDGANKEPDQQRLDANIRTLRATLESAVIAETPSDQSKVVFGAFVTVSHQDGERDEYQIVGIDEADPAAGRISWISPLARVLLSRSAGDHVSFRSPAGVEELTIHQLRY
jgi:transcription elongation factor GreB